MASKATAAHSAHSDSFPERVIRLADYRAHPSNYNQHPPRQIERLRLSLRKFGQPRNIVVWRSYYVAGHGVAEAAAAEGWETLRANEIPAHWDEERVVAFLAADNELGRLSDPDQVTLAAILDEASQFDPELLAAIGFDDNEFQALLDSVGGLDSAGGSAGVEPAGPPTSPGIVGDAPTTDSEGGPAIERAPDAVWPTNNDLGIPLLDLNMQAKALDQPWAIWGAAGRKARMEGTWLFYTEDYRYEALWADPSPILATRCVNAVEPNFSCYENMPPAVAIWQIYRKRWIARWWQSCGVRIFVDLNVAVNHYDLNLLGIPAGWRAFATRGYAARIDATHAEYSQACHIASAGSDEPVTPLFVVYGGGKAVKEACRANGWLWLQEDMDTAKGREV